MTDKITMILITYRNDFDLLKRFLDSVYDNFQTDQIHEIIIVLNDRYMYKQAFDELITSKENPSVSIRRIWANELFPKLEHYNWYSQQLLKLLVSKVVETKHYIIHDCKDYYIFPTF
jgi:hypothetical protein